MLILILVVNICLVFKKDSDTVGIAMQTCSMQSGVVILEK